MIKAFGYKMSADDTELAKRALSVLKEEFELYDTLSYTPKTSPFDLVIFFGDKVASRYSNIQAKEKITLPMLSELRNLKENKETRSVAFKLLKKVSEKKENIQKSVEKTTFSKKHVPINSYEQTLTDLAKQGVKEWKVTLKDGEEMTIYAEVPDGAPSGTLSFNLFYLLNTLFDKYGFVEVDIAPNNSSSTQGNDNTGS